jgi:hypothetical protein
MPDSNLFSPKTAGTVSITCAVTSARVALVPKGGFQLAITNSDTSNIAYVEVGDSSVTATVPNGATPGSMPILPGQTRGVSIAGASVTHAAAICSAGTPLVFFTPGNGT